MSCDAVARVLAGYQTAAPGLIARFEALSSSQILAPVADLLPPPPGPALDIGAGTGRDAAWLARRGYHTCAVEPVVALRAAGQARHGDIIDWCDDRLPDLPVLRGAAQRYQLVLANGVLHHLPPAGQITAIDSMARLLAPGGRAVLSLRHGPTPPDRPGFAIDTTALVRYAERRGLTILRCRTGLASVQPENRAAGVRRDWLCLSRE